jgi:uridine phosphorylase
MTVSRADRPQPNGVPYHIPIAKGKLPRYALLPGSPERAIEISKHWGSSTQLAGKREFLTLSGVYRGVRIACTSIGIGSAAASIAVEELASLGVDTMVRVGSTGSIQRDAGLGDLIINTASVRYDGTTDNYVPPVYPAHASMEVTMALIEAAESLGYRYHVGVSCSTSSFYAGQSRTGFKGYTQPWIEERISVMRRAGVLNFEEEASTIFVLSSIYGLRAGAVSFVIADRVRDAFDYRGEERAIRVANESIRILAEWDRAKEGARRRHFFPSLLKTMNGRALG